MSGSDKPEDIRSPFPEWSFRGPEKLSEDLKISSDRLVPIPPTAMQIQSLPYKASIDVYQENIATITVTVEGADSGWVRDTAVGLAGELASKWLGFFRREV